MATTSDSGIRLNKLAGSNWNYIEYSKAGVRTNYIGTDSAGTANFIIGSDNAAANLYFGGFNGVGIGTSTPGAKLEVV